MVLDKKNILIFADYFLPGYKAGGPIQSLNNIVKVLRSLGNVYIICRNHDWGNPTPYEEPIAQWVDKGDYYITYLDKKRINSKKILFLVKEVNPYIIFLNSIYSIFTRTYFRLLLEKKVNIKVILAPRGELNGEAIAIKKAIKLPYLYTLKILKLTQKVIWYATTDKEKNDIINQFGEQQEIIVIPNIPRQHQEDWQEKKKDITTKMVAVGRIDKMKNIGFLLQCLSYIKENLILDIIGSTKDTEYANKCYKIAKEIKENVQINFLGDLPPNEVAKKLKEYHFFISPTLGENFGHAIFEGLLAGLPAIISDRTSWNNIQKSNAGWVLPLENSKEWIDIINKGIIMSEKEYNSYTFNAWTFANEYNKNDTSIHQIKQLFS